MSQSTVSSQNHPSTEPPPRPARQAAPCTIPVRKPFPWRAMLHYLGGRHIPNSERVDGAVYIRDTDAPAASIEIRYAREHAHLRLRISGDANADAIEARARQLFAPEHDAAAIEPLAADPILRSRILATPGLRPLGCWDPFELCVRTLIGQQVSVRAAQCLTARIVDRCGTLQPAPLADANLERIGMPGRRVAAIQNFAKLVSTRAIDLTADWVELEPALAELPGFGPWTCAYLGIRLGRDPDAFPAADVGLMRATGAASAKALARMADAWRPWRAFAATYLWLDPPARAGSPGKFSGG